jgi:hypothetical protein
MLCHSNTRVADMRSIGNPGFFKGFYFNVSYIFVVLRQTLRRGAAFVAGWVLLNFALCSLRFEFSHFVPFVY